MSKYCILLSKENYFHVFEPFLRRRHIRLPSLIFGDIIAVYINRECVFHMLDNMAEKEIETTGAIFNAFRCSIKISDPYSLEKSIKNQSNPWVRPLSDR